MLHDRVPAKVSGDEGEIAGEDYLLLRERDIHSIVARRVEANTGLYL